MADSAPTPGSSVSSDTAKSLDAILAQAATFADPASMGVTAGAPSSEKGAGAAGGGAATAADSDSAFASPSAFPDQASIDELLRQATFEEPGVTAAGMDAIGDGSGAPAIDAEAFRLPNFNQVIQDAQVSSIDLLRDVELNVKIELGRSRMLVEDVLRLAEGSVVELDKLAGDPVDVFVNDRLVARGEVLVLNDNFCVRVNEIVAASKEEGL